MAKFIQNQSLLLLEKLNELDLDAEADLCEKLHDDAEHLFRTLSSRLDELQDGNWWPECLLVKRHGLLRLVAPQFTRWLTVGS
ncbi:Rop family plasmid primer RNA-binding protein [Mycoplasmoides pneumoniae]|uniref:Rop family plasmid primer RNA-binding protein n=1 Tax=Mycoplasmoides pneumoniae TaxID=2104 RepID=UPI003F69B292